MNEENALELPKEAKEAAIKHFARYSGAIPQILKAKGGKHIFDIYIRRGYIEVEESEYQRILKLKREALEKP